MNYFKYFCNVKNNKPNTTNPDTHLDENLEDLEKRLMSRAANLKERFSAQAKPTRKKTFTATPNEGGVKKNFDSKPFEKKSFDKSSYDKKPFEKKSFDKPSYDKKPFEKKSFDKPSYDKKPFEKKSFDKPSYDKKPFDKKSFDKPGFDKKPFEKKSFDKSSYDKKPFDKKSFDKPSYDKKPFDRSFDARPDKKKSELGYERKKLEKKPYEKNPFLHKEHYDKSTTDSSSKANTKKTNTTSDPDTIRLNKYIASCGIAARRKADELIAQGQVRVNDVVITEMGYRVHPKDVIQYNNKIVKPIEKNVYILLNKPKDTLTTVSDDRGRNTIMDYLQIPDQKRIYPVGRLDRNTTGVLLITNDGDLAQHLTHPSSMTEKVYEILLDRPLSKADYDQIAAGIELVDGFIKPDNIAFPDPKDKFIVGIEIHSGRNRIVRRIFESLNYKIEKLDRVVFAGLTKKNLSRGKWRHLTEKEVIMLKHFTKNK